MLKLNKIRVIKKKNTVYMFSGGKGQQIFIIKSKFQKNFQILTIKKREVIILLESKKVSFSKSSFNVFDLDNFLLM